MAGFYGGDTEQMRAQAQACELGSQRIHEVTDALGVVIDSVPWFGPDAIALRALWHGTVKPGMIAKAEDIRAKGMELDDHATEQDRVSGPTDLAGLIDVLLDKIRGPFGDLPPFAGPMPGLPLTPDMIRKISDGMHDWFTGENAEGDHYMYGSGDDFGPGQVAADDRPIGPDEAGGSHWDGREIDNDRGYVDGYAHTRASAGAHATQDEYGNYTATAGMRAAAEIGFDEALYGPDGKPLLSADGRLGAEAYAEGGGSIGPDGISGGGRAGFGAYGDLSAKLDLPHGASYELGLEGYAGAHAEANAYANVTRNDDGQVNGMEWGARAEAFAGAEGKMTFEEHSPGGWFSAKGSAGGQAGAGAGVETGGSFSTDKISLGLGGQFAWGGGATGDVEIAIHPNAIVDTFTPGDYNLDDVLSDLSGAARDTGNWVADNWPF